MKKHNLFRIRYFAAAEYLKHYQLSLFSILIFGVFLSSCSVRSKEIIPVIPAPTESIFDQYEIITGTAKHQTILTGFLLTDILSDIAVVSTGTDNERHLRIYAPGDDAWVPRLDMPLRPEVLFVDIANIDGHDRLLTYEQGRLNWFDPESMTEHILVEVNTNYYNLVYVNEVPHVDITRDLNGDSLDDLVVPDDDGFWVFVQMDNGAFADPVKLGPPFEIDRLYCTLGYRYNPWHESRIHEVDYNRDGRNDLVFWDKDHFRVHLQDEHGLFVPVATTFTTDVAFDSDDIASLAAPYGVRRRRRDHYPTGDLTGRVLHALRDMNGDGVADLGVFSLGGGSLWHMYSTYTVYFGTPTPDGRTTFTSEISTSITSDGIPFGLVQHDFDNDNQVDMMFTTLTLGVMRLFSMIIDSVLTDFAPRDLEFYRMEENTYPDKPNAIRESITYPAKRTGEITVFLPVLIGDVNGDKRSDLLVQQGPKELYVFMGVPGPDPFAQRPQKVKVTMPLYEGYTWLLDLDKDSNSDVFIHHMSPTDPHRVTLLIAR